MAKSAFTVLELAAVWHELMMLQRTMRPSIACSSKRLDLQFAAPPQLVTLGIHPVVCKLLIISHPTEGRRLSWCVNHWLAVCFRTVPATSVVIIKCCWYVSCVCRRCVCCYIRCCTQHSATRNVSRSPTALPTNSTSSTKYSISLYISVFQLSAHAPLGGHEQDLWKASWSLLPTIRKKEKKEYFLFC